MSNRFSLKNYGLVILALAATCAIPESAYAGFQFVAPAAPSPTAPVPQAAPVPETESAPLAPMTPLVSTPAPAPASAPAPQATGTPQSLAPITTDNNPPAVTLTTTAPAPLTPPPPAPVQNPVATETTAPEPIVPAAVTPLPPVTVPNPAVPETTAAVPAVPPAVAPPAPVPLPSVETPPLPPAPPVATQDMTPPPVVIDGNSHPASPPPAPMTAPPAPASPDLPAPIVIQGNTSSSAAPPKNSVILPPSPPAPAVDTATSAPVLLPITPVASSPSTEEPVITPASAPVIEPEVNVQPELALAPPPPLPPASSVPVTSTDDDSAVHGFANHVPLAVALREILPPGYGFSVDQDVDLGVLISFRGGKPWRDTLNQALEPAGLIMREKGQMVEIGYPAGKDLVSSPSPSSSPSTTPKLAGAVHFDAPTPPPAQPVITPTPAVMNNTIDQPIPTLASTPPQTWDAEPGDSLHKVLEIWSHRANIELDWMAEYDYPLQASAHFSGSFEDAVRNLLTGFEGAHPQPVAELHSNSKAGQMVLVVTTRGNSSD